MRRVISFLTHAQKIARPLRLWVSAIPFWSRRTTQRCSRTKARRKRSRKWSKNSPSPKTLSIWSKSLLRVNPTSQAGLLQVQNPLSIIEGMQMDVLLQPAAQSPRKLDRVRNSTPSRVNCRIDQAMMKRIWNYARRSREEITARIEQLE